MRRRLVLYRQSMRWPQATLYESPIAHSRMLHRKVLYGQRKRAVLSGYVATGSAANLSCGCYRLRSTNATLQTTCWHQGCSTVQSSMILQNLQARLVGQCSAGSRHPARNALRHANAKQSRPTVGQALRSKDMTVQGIVESRVRFPEKMRLRVPRGLRGAVKCAADRRFTSPAEWVRQAIMRELEAEGVRVLHWRDGA